MPITGARKITTLTGLLSSRKTCWAYSSKRSSTAVLASWMGGVIQTIPYNINIRELGKWIIIECCDNNL